MYYERFFQKSSPGNYTPAPRFPQYTDIDDLKARLCALLRLEVGKRSNVFVLDENTANKIAQVAEWIISSKQNGLLLCGSLGNGKSTMLCALHRLIPNSDMFYANSIYRLSKNGYTDRTFDAYPLIIDDLGIEPVKATNYGEESYPLVELLLRRYSQNAITIIATNLNIDAIRDRYGVRVCDRILEMFHVIVYDAPSYRNRKK